MRQIPSALEDALNEGTRWPAYKVLAYDPGEDTMSDIVTGQATQTPLDLTEYVSQVSWTPDRLNFVLSDPDGRFNPDFGQHKNYVRHRAVLRLIEGDERVDDTDWVVTFTGQINGQPGWIKSRRSQTQQARISVFNRGAWQPFTRRKITSSEYTVGTEAGVFLRDILTTFFGLTEDEIRIPSTLGFQLLHNVNQLVQVTPWEGVNAILETVNGVASFDGEGKITYYSKNLNRMDVRVLPNYVKVFEYETPDATFDGINSVTVRFLSAYMEEVEGPYQVLGTASITTGFFTFEENLPCYWSEDRRLRARNTVMKVIKSVNDNLLPVGEESYEQNDDFHGTITIDIYFYVPILATAMMAEYIYLSFEPDWADVPMFGVWPTITWGKFLQAQALVGILVIMMSLGSAQYEILGIPYEMAYVEKECTAEEDGLEYWEKVEKEIENDFVGTLDQAQPIAVTELIWEKSNLNKRRLQITDDLAIELGDIIELPTRQRFCVTAMSKQIQKGQTPVLVLDGFKVLIGSETGTLEV